jgi:superfamily II DNA or RNA helicase
VKQLKESTALLVKSIGRSLKLFRVKEEHTRITAINSKVLGARTQPTTDRISMPGIHPAEIRAKSVELLPFHQQRHSRWPTEPEFTRTVYDEGLALDSDAESMKMCDGDLSPEPSDGLSVRPAWECDRKGFPAGGFYPTAHINPVVTSPEVQSGNYRDNVLCNANLLPLPSDCDLTIHRLDMVTFKVVADGYRFAENRQEGPSGLFNRSKGTPSQSLPRVAALESPPEVKASSLAERLRWILTPPVNQLIADLFVPDHPFAFQLQGIQWLMQRDHALLADEMGLGKTIQAILAARLLWRQRRIESLLVICPKSLIGNWKREFAKWWPDAALHLLEAQSDRRWFLRMSSPTVLVKMINYEALAKDKEWLQDNPIQHDLVIIDEAQRIKSLTSKTAAAVKCLRGRRCWALTGTPLENRVEDLISIMEFVHPEAVRHSGNDVRSVQRAVKSYILRRRLDDPSVGIQLPQLLDQDIEVELTEAQRQSYESAERDGVSSLNAKGETITVQHVFALIGKLIQLCNFDSATGESAKFDRLVDDFEEVTESDKKALIFSRYVSEEFGLRRLATLLTARSHRILELHGEIPPARRDGIITRFNESPAERALLINYAVGSVGLNLQAAGYVFLFDRWWNPAVEDQAIKRAHRFGQTSRVIVRRYFCKNTIEERILSVLKKKRGLFREIIDGEQQPHTAMGMTEQELFGLFDLKVRPPRAAKSDGISELRFADLDWYKFECLVADLYRAQDFRVERTGGSGDGGIDVLAERKSSSGLERIVVQCKHMAAPIGPEILRAHWGVVNNDQSFTSGHLVTSSVFSSDAKSFANGKRLHLIDGRRLKELLQQYGVARIVD